MFLLTQVWLFFVTDIQLLVIIATYIEFVQILFLNRKAVANYSYVSDPFSVATEHTCKGPELQN